MSPKSCLVLGVVLATAVGLGASEALAQLPQHRLQSIFPAGGQQGETVQVRINGTDLEGLDGLWFDHPGIRAFHIKEQIFQVAIAPGTPLGQHDVRLVGRLGVSNPRTFVVGDLPESVEKESNNTPKEANPIAINSVMNGHMDSGADLDHFVFQAQAGQRVLIDLAGFRIETRLDGVLRLLEEKGAEIAASQDARGADPMLDFTAPAEGKYIIQVQDVVYNGSIDHGYRLTIHDGPYIDAIVPRVAAANTTPEFTLLGRNLGGEIVDDLRVNGVALERKTVTIPVPAPADLDPTYPSLGFLPAPAAARRGMEYRFQGHDGRLSNPVFIAAASGPITLEKEPNDGEESCQALGLPCDVSGTFGQPGDLDVYRFEAKKGQTWIIEATAERLGSPADPSVVVQRLNEKGEASDVLTADDTPEIVRNAPFSVESVDAESRWQVPADGKYQILVSDLFGSQRGDPRFAYRLKIRPEAPDFRLFVVPLGPQNQPDSLVIRAGGRADLTVYVDRMDGMDQPIRLEISNLPAGLTCAPVVIGTGDRQVKLVLEAAKEMTPTNVVLDVIGRAVAPDRKESLEYKTGSAESHAAVGREPWHSALAGTLVWGSQGGNQAALSRVSRGLVIAVREEAPFLLNVSPARPVVAQEGQVELTIDLQRNAGFTEAVNVNVVDLPRNVQGGNATIAKDQTSARITLKVNKNAKPGMYSFLVRGTGPFPFSKNPKDEKKPNVNVNEPSNPVILTIIP